MTNNKSKVKKRELWLDVIRIFAFFCVLIAHSPAPYDGLAKGRFFISAYNYIGQSCGPDLFFMISGALLLYNKQSFIPFIKKRLLRIIPPVLIWTIISLLSYTFIYKTLTPSEMLHRFLLIPFGAQAPEFWFIYEIIGIYLVIPMISSWLESAKRREVEIILGIWAISMCFPYLLKIDTSFAVSLSDGEGWLYNFYSYCGFCLFGYYLRRYINLLTGKAIFAVIFGLVLPGILEYIFVLPHDAINNMKSINAAFLAGSVFLLLKGIPSTLLMKYKGSLIMVSNLSFGVYLIHMHVLRVINSFIGPLHINYLIQIPLTAILTGVISLLFVLLLSKLPYSKHLVG